MSRGETGSALAVTVRRAVAREADLLIGWQQRMALETEGLALDPDILGRGVRAVFDDPGLGEYWIAEPAGPTAVVGDWAGGPVGSLLLTREWSDWRNGTVLWIQSVYVVPEIRGRGVYRALYEHFQRRVRAAPDLVGLRLYVDQRNTAAATIYERLGMAGNHYSLYEWLK
jgi:GNAT superfamily N-acetyltransferase